MPQQYSRIVMTCGVSLFSGSNQYRRWAEEQKLLCFPGPSPNPECPPGNSIKETLTQWEKACNRLASEKHKPEDPKRVSAEFSAMNALQRQDRLTRNPQVILIHTDTLGGQTVVRLLSVLLKTAFNADVECHDFHMNVSDPKELRYNLGDFMQKVAAALKGYEPSTTCYAPLGGYKIMTSLGYLAGAYFGFPTLYTHEDDQIVHEVPAVPVTPGELKTIAPLMKRIGSACSLSELTQSQKVEVDEYSWLFERADDMISVNAFGVFLMQQPENASLFDCKIKVSGDIDRDIRDNRREFVQQQLKVLAGKLSAGSTEADLKHELTWPHIDKDGDWHLYRGASNGQLAFRAIYRYEPEHNRLSVKQVWTDHKKYEDEFKQSWGRSMDTPIDWSP